MSSVSKLHGERLKALRDCLITKERDGAASSGKDTLSTFRVLLYSVLHGGHDETERTGNDGSLAGIVKTIVVFVGGHCVLGVCRVGRFKCVCCWINPSEKQIERHPKSGGTFLHFNDWQIDCDGFIVYDIYVCVQVKNYIQSRYTTQEEKCM